MSNIVPVDQIQTMATAVAKSGLFGVKTPEQAMALMLIAPPLAKVALSFSSPEYFALMVLGLAMVVLLAGASLLKGLLAMLVGLWIATMGTESM